MTLHASMTSCYTIIDYGILYVSMHVDFFISIHDIL